MEQNNFVESFSVDSKSKWKTRIVAVLIGVYLGILPFGMLHLFLQNKQLIEQANFNREEITKFKNEVHADLQSMNTELNLAFNHTKASIEALKKPVVEPPTPIVETKVNAPVKKMAAKKFRKNSPRK